MISLQTNLSGLITQRNLSASANKLNQAIERLSTGYKINHASDNAANYSISKNMSVQLSACDVAADNISMGMDLVSTAQDTISELQDRGSRLQTLVTQARNGTYGEDSIAAMEKEAEALTEEIYRLYSNTEYNGIKLLSTYMPDWAKSVKSSAGLSGGINLNPGYNEITINEGGIPQELKSILMPEYNEDSDVISAQVPSEIKSKAGNFDSIETVTPDVISSQTTLSDDLDNHDVVGIEDAATLMALSELSAYDFTGKTIVLTADIDLTDVNWEAINFFNGVFDGQGHTISNLNSQQGLFSDLDGVVRNLAISGEVINIKSDNVGLLAGSTGTGSYVENCYTTGTIQGDAIVGGLVGYAKGKITGCYSSASVTGGNKSIAGGLVGGTAGVINYSYATGDVEGSGTVGGLIGAFDDVKMDFSYIAALGEVHKLGDGGNAGSLIGSTSEVGTISDAYALYQNGLSAIGKGGESVDVTSLFNEVSHSAGYRGFMSGFTESNPDVVAVAKDYEELQGILDKNDTVGIGDIDTLMALSELASKGYDFTGKTIVLTADIDLTDVEWTAIDAFTGKFDGNGHTISNLGAGKQPASAGLFGGLKDCATIQNLAVTNAVIQGESVVGILASDIPNSVYIKNCYTTGSINGNNYVGGLVGYSEGNITGCYSTASVSGDEQIGGLAGAVCGGVIEESYASGEVSGGASVGGFAGKIGFADRVTSALAMGRVSGDSDFGSFVGALTDPIYDFLAYVQKRSCPTVGLDCAGQSNRISEYAINISHPAGYRGFINGFDEVSPEVVISTKESAELKAAFESYDIVGIGDVSTLMALSDLTANEYDFDGKTIVLTADIDLTGCSWTPICDFNNGTFNGNGHTISNLGVGAKVNGGLFQSVKNSLISNLAVTNAVIDGENNVGILANRMQGNIVNCYTTGSVRGGKGVGGLAGSVDGDIEHCYSTASVKGNVNVGGLVGYSEGNISYSYATGDVSGETYVGGLVAYCKEISNCYATGNVSGFDYVGGLAANGENITNSYALGNVTGEQFAGGLAANAKNVVNCYSKGNVLGNKCVGGLVSNAAEISNCYSTGSVSGASNVGGLAFYANSVDNCYTTGNINADEDCDSFVYECENVSSECGVFKPTQTNLCVGIDGSADSIISVDTNISVDIRLNNLRSDDSYRSITNFMNQLSQKSVELGAAQNRLESALESTLVKMDNLASSLSTIRDADVGEISSKYIRQQILQQACATLMVTANQSPAIALQLI